MLIFIFTSSPDLSGASKRVCVTCRASGREAEVSYCALLVAVQPPPILPSVPGGRGPF